MSDQTIPADLHPEDVEHARSYVQDFLDATYAPDRTLAVARVLQALLPAPPLPTLADMSPEERSACRWMQADVKDRGGRYVVANPFDEDGDTGMVSAYGGIEWMSPERVTPRPDLPRMTWPGDTPEAPAPAPPPALPDGWRLADHPGHGRVVVTSATPDADGHVCFVAPAPGIIGNDWHLCKHDELTYLDTPDAVPESTLAVGSVWDDADALTEACEETGRDQIVVLNRDGDAYVWSCGADWWECGSPRSDSAPLTVLHAGQEADQ